MLHLLWMLIIGLVVGAIARLIFPGTEQMSLIVTCLVGIAGSYVGGFLARLFSKPALNSPVHPTGIIMSIIGALVVLFILSKVGR